MSVTRRVHSIINTIWDFPPQNRDKGEKHLNQRTWLTWKGEALSHQGEAMCNHSPARNQATK